RSSGYGPTENLSRMLRALLETDKDGNEVQPHEILAITFTKKAAGEMRERLYEWLETFAHADDETLRQELVLRGVSSQKSPQSSPHLREQLSNLYQRVLANGRPVQIRTFHSWFAALLRSAPMATLQHLGLPVNYELLEDDAPAKALVWRRFYAALVKDEALKADFETVVMAHGRFQADKALHGALDKRTEFLLADAEGVVDSSVQHFGVQFAELDGLNHPDELFSASPANQQLLMAAAGALGRASAKTFSAKGVELEKALSEGEVSAALIALLTEKGTPRKFGEKIAGIEVVREAQDLALRILEARLQFEAWDYQQRMARLARLLLAEFKALKREHGWVDMNDVERAALVMLSDEVLSGWVQERLDARVRHLMIDEAQDTNPLQWQALHSWLSGYGGAGKAPSVFIVGDPKQSIYRFRRAEPQVFIAAQAFVRNILGGDLLACDHTRRNSAAVINTVNAAMATASENDGYEGFREHSSASAEQGSVLRLPPIQRTEKSETAPAGTEWRDSLSTPRELPEETLRTVEARQAAAWIARQIASGLKPSNVMVLSRKRAGLMPLQDELRALHIAAQIGEKTELIDCCEVLDIVALLDVLVSPQHDLSLARALRSPLFGVSDARLVQIALLKGDSKLSWFEVLQDQELATPELSALGAQLLKFKVWIDAFPPHDALQAIYHDADVLARFAAAAPAASRGTVLANLRALLNVALQLDGGRYATSYAFVRALKAGGLQAPAAVNPDAVRLLTIHGAKGLEAHSVLLLDTDTVERNADSMSVLVDWPGEATAPAKFVFLVSESRPPACAAEALATEQAARKREELNALYVALTRARHTLAVSSIEPYRETTHSWWQRLFALASEVPAPVAATAVADDEADESGVFNLPDLPVFTPPPACEAPEAEAEEDSDSARIGKAMHRLLEWGIAQDPASAAPALLAKIGREFVLKAGQLAEAQVMASRIRKGEAAWAWDEARLSWQANEIELIYRGQALRLDRLVQRRDGIHAGHWWVLDYKSAHQPQLDPVKMAQMRAYKAALQLIYPGQTVKAAFLTGAGAVVEVA
ncbi:MAG: UvrD-helicase domain-containing protein, partial [Pseudomonadota bacterium]